MRTLALALCLLGLALHGSAQTLVDSFAYGDNVRSYRLHFPNGDSAAATGLPLVLNMHGITSNATEQEGYTEMNGYADTAGYVICYPNGLLSPEDSNTGNQREWSVGFLGRPVTDDAGFLSALVDSLTERYALDTARVFATGFSNGGFMAYQLACAYPEKFAAIASVAGGIAPGRAAGCTPGAPVPVMQIHGTDDQTVPFGGSFINDPTDSTVAFWVREDGCSTPPVVAPIVDRDPSDGATSTRTVYDTCAAGARVEYLIVSGGGHAWPGAAFPLPGRITTQDFEASQEVLAFFDRFPSADTGTTGINDFLGLRQNPSLVLYPNPSSGTAVSTDATDAHRTFELRDAAGRRLATLELPAGRTDLTFDRLPAGNYLLRERTRGGAAAWFNVR